MCDCLCHKAYKECDNCCKPMKPKFYQFDIVLTIRTIGISEEAARESAKEQMSKRLGLTMDYINEAFDKGLSLNKVFGLEHKN